MELFLTIAITHFIALLTPGVDFFLILKTVMQYRGDTAKFVCIGIACGNGLILLCIYLSLFVLGKLNTDVLLYIKYLSAIYLIYLSFQCFKASRVSYELNPFEINEIISNEQKSYFKCFLMGIASSLLNPKNMMFYSTLVILIYPKFSFTQNLLVCCWMVSVVLFWNLAIVRLLSLKTYLLRLQRNMHFLYGISGICFAVFAVILFI